jgi:hypothetical protein
MKPLLELRSFVDKKSREEVTAIDPEGLFNAISAQALLEQGHVAGDSVKIDCNFFVSARQDRIIAEGSSEEMKRLSQRRARVLLIGVWPEQAEQRITVMESTRLSDAEVCEQRNPLRLREQRV